ncbi:MAG TPA: hypothetical protein VFB20_16795 [Burkholderiales bacterium]|nr:hypothetical protein [Burkholderiales bacterium]
MRLGDTDSYVDIESRGTVAANMPRAGDLRLRVTVHGAGFHGVQDEVWVRQGAVERFIAEVYAMARGEREEAALGGASAREITLRFTRPMRTHVLLEGKVKRVGPGSPATISAWIAFAVYVPADALAELADTLSEAWISSPPSKHAH